MANDESTYRPGDRLGGYELIRELDRGGSGTVWEGRDAARGQPVALKILRRLSAATLAALKSEVRLLGELGHPGLVAAYELVEAEPAPAFVMELVQGRHLDAWVRAVPTATGRAQRLRTALLGLAEVVEYLHAANVLHLDLKARNVLVRPSGEVAVLDLGVSRVMDEAGWTLQGSRFHIAPEVLGGAVPTAAADWYAVGVIAAITLTGVPPAPGLRQAPDQDPPPIVLPVGTPAVWGTLVDELLRVDPARRADGSRIRELLGARPGRVVGSPPNARPECRGREADLAWLDAVAPAPALVIGEGGIGKSRLLAAAGWDHRRAGGLVCAGRCRTLASVPFPAFDEILETLHHHLADELPELAGDDAPRVSQLFPGFGLRAVRRGAEPAADRLEAFAAVGRLFARVAARVPLLLIVDDLQDADGDSVALLRTLLATPGAPRVLAASRVPLPSLPELRSRSIAPLPEEAARALLRERLGPDAGDLDEMVRSARGNPFLLSEWGRARGLDRTRSLAGRLRARAAEQASWGPRAVEVVAVAGHPLGLTPLAAALGVPVDLAGLHRLCAAGLLRRVASGVVEPAHAAVAEAVLDEVPAVERVATHHALALALLAEPGAEPAWLARHLAGGGDRAAAVPWVLAAAERAEAALAFDAAAGHLAQAIAWSDPPDDTLVDRRAAALLAAGRPVEAAEVWATLAPRSRAAHARAAEAFLLGGAVNHGMDALAPALAGLGAPPLPRGRAAVLRLLSLVVTLLLPAPRVAADPALVDLLWAAGRGLSPVLPMEGMCGMLESLRLARRSRDGRRVARVLGFLAVALEQAPGLGWLGRMVAARAARVDPVDPYVAAYADLWEGARELAAGRWEEGADRAGRAAGRFRDECVAVSWELVQAESQLVLAASQQGAYPVLQARAREALATAISRGDLYGECIFRQYLATAALADDAVEAARAHARWITERWAVGTYTLPHFFARSIEILALLYEGAPAPACAAALAEERARVHAAGGHHIALWRIELVLLEARIALAAAAPPAELRALARRLAAEPRRDGAAWARVLEAAAEGTGLEPASDAFEAGGEQALAAGYALQSARRRGHDPGPAETRLRALGVVQPDRWIRAFTPWPPPS